MPIQMNWSILTNSLLCTSQVTLFHFNKFISKLLDQPYQLGNLADTKNRYATLDSRWHVRTANIQIGLFIHTVWSQS